MSGQLPVLSEGDVVLVRFDPAFGHEQTGTRPALVVSRSIYNALSSFVVVCPLTTNAKAWPFKLPLPTQSTVKGFVLADQLKSIDRRRVVRKLSRLDTAFLDEVRALMDHLLPASPERPPIAP
ncbi:type II toxin-antitoxin system PemK/MazF family toxin [uncultured Alsobacter sp.]|uniref:type II toxin-antitoxin system PemK/MazF family toxin n=1 Tax=uncultured Alsobacter sp. TaxID=1748258 RepID=UPI0025EABE59|nr:type II toxin-antitoxin system PemK/MazF family toxin [uncultured Alsobacter sp.]